MSLEEHNTLVPRLLRELVLGTTTEVERWIILESLCLGVGLLHERSGRQTGEFIETMATRIATGERT